MSKVKKTMAVKGIKDTEKIAVGAIRTAIQTWLAPELRTIGERLTHVEARLDGLEQRVGGLEKRTERLESRMDQDFKSLRGEFGTHFEALRGEFTARFDTFEKRMERFETRTDEGCKEWGEVNERKYLFRSVQSWTRQQVHAFINSAWDYVGVKQRNGV